MTGVAPLTSPLFVPATRPERFAKAAASGADGIILDLEDAIAADAKDMARAAGSTATHSALHQHHRRHGIPGRRRLRDQARSRLKAMERRHAQHSPAADAA